MAARDGDIARALAVYDHARAEGIRLSPDSISTLLYLCSLGEGRSIMGGRQRSVGVNAVVLLVPFFVRERGL